MQCGRELTVLFRRDQVLMELRRRRALYGEPFPDQAFLPGGGHGSRLWLPSPETNSAIADRLIAALQKAEAARLQHSRSFDEVDEAILPDFAMIYTFLGQLFDPVCSSGTPVCPYARLLTGPAFQGSLSFISIHGQ